MSDIATKSTSVAVKEESVEGTYVAPASAADFVQTLASGLELKPQKELLDRNIFSASIGAVTPRTGTKSVSGNIPCEARAFSVEGSAPEYNSLMKSALGTRRQNTTVVTSKASGNTASVMQIEDADISKFNIGDCILVKAPGAFHMSPILSKTSGAGTATITLLIPHPAGDIPDSCTISKFTTYTVAETGHPTLSITKYLGAAIEQIAMGCRVNKLSLSNFATGKIPEMQFGVDGLDFDRNVAAPAFTPSYDDALPPIALDGRIYLDTTAIQVNEFSLNLENTVGFKTSFSASNGKISSSVTARKITGTIDPYQDSADISNYTKFLNNTEFSLFVYAKNDSGVAGEFKNVIAFYLPKCLITEISEADADGLVKESLSFTASRGAAGTTNEIYITVI